MISDEAKLELLTHLRRSAWRRTNAGDAAAPRKITLKRKSQSELKLAGTQGRARTVNVEVRRKRTYIKRDVLEEAGAGRAGSARRRAPRTGRARIAPSARARARQGAEQRMRAEGKRSEAKPKRTESRRRSAEEEQRARPQRKQRATRRKKKRACREKAEAPERTSQQGRRKAPRSGPEKAKDTRYGRKELHVAGDKRGTQAKRVKERTGRRGARYRWANSQHGFERPTAPVKREVEIGETITPPEICAERLAVKANEVIKV